MAGTTISVDGALTEFPITILTKFGGDPVREALIKLHLSISGNAAFVVENIGGVRHRHLALTTPA